MTLLVTEVVEHKFCECCTDTLPSRAVNSGQPRFMLSPSTDALKYKLVKVRDLVPFFVTLHSLKCVPLLKAHTSNLQRKPNQCLKEMIEYFIFLAYFVNFLDT